MIKRVNFKELRSQLSFEEILAHYQVSLKGSNGQLSGFCPLPTHQGKGEGKRSPSFSANTVKGIWQCFGCGAKGNLIEFAGRMEGFNPEDPQDFRKIALMLHDRYVGNGKPAVPAVVPAGQASQPVPEKETTKDLIVNARLDFELKSLDYNHPYLKSRGFSDAVIQAFGLGYCSRGLMRGRIAIPLHDKSGMLIGYAGRIVDDNAISETVPRYLYPSAREWGGVRYEFHKSEFVYNGHRIEGATDLVVVESFTAVWWLAQADLSNVVAVMGASVSENQARIITELVPEDGRIWVMPDGDHAGERMAESAVKLLAPHRFVRWVKLDDGKQPTDVSPDELHQLLPVI
jgi:DNA primase